MESDTGTYKRDDGDVTAPTHGFAGLKGHRAFRKRYTEPLIGDSFARLQTYLYRA